MQEKAKWQVAKKSLHSGPQEQANGQGEIDVESVRTSGLGEWQIRETAKKKDWVQVPLGSGAHLTQWLVLKFSSKCQQFDSFEQL